MKARLHVPSERIEPVPGIVAELERRAAAKPATAIKIRDSLFMLLDADQTAEWADLQSRGLTGDA